MLAMLNLENISFFFLSLLIIAIFLILYLLNKLRTLEFKYLDLLNKVESDHAISIGMGKKINYLEARLRKNEYNSSDEIDPRLTSFSESVFNQALDKLNRGESEEDVAIACGLSESEISLMKLMHSN